MLVLSREGCPNDWGLDNRKRKACPVVFGTEPPKNVTKFNATKELIKLNSGLSNKTEETTEDLGESDLPLNILPRQGMESTTPPEVLKKGEQKVTRIKKEKKRVLAVREMRSAIKRQKTRQKNVRGLKIAASVVKKLKKREAKFAKAMGIPPQMASVYQVKPFCSLPAARKHQEILQNTANGVFTIAEYAKGRASKMRIVARSEVKISCRQGFMETPVEGWSTCSHIDGKFYPPLEPALVHCYRIPDCVGFNKPSLKCAGWKPQITSPLRHFKEVQCIRAPKLPANTVQLNDFSDASLNRSILFSTSCS
jgi:hypothetical protein